KAFRSKGTACLSQLEEMKKIADREIAISRKMIEYCKRNSLLGFHSEAEGYKYFPDLIEWRVRQLEYLRDRELPDLAKKVRKGEDLYPEYTGQKPVGAQIRAIKADSNLLQETESGSLNPNRQFDWQFCEYGSKRSAVRWAIGYDSDSFYLILEDRVKSGKSPSESPFTELDLTLEKQRLIPGSHYKYSLNDPSQTNVKSGYDKKSGIWRTVVQIPFRDLEYDGKLTPLRGDISIQLKTGSVRWRPMNRKNYRLSLSPEDPFDLGWILFDVKK
ncbi:MAG: hypothetical protein Q4G69_12065, partial [Planctomycetia bacterium]|nr:hypothetical protein [Planctomycetia bacterium]